MIPEVINIKPKCPGCGTFLNLYSHVSPDRLPEDWPFSYVKGRYLNYFADPAYS